jgi:hypothetical protein
MGFPLLDSSLRDYIFIPLTIITICVSLLMKYLNTLFNKGNKPELHSETKTLEDFSIEQELKSRDTDLRIQNAIARANLLKDNFMYISEKGFKKRQAFFNEFFSRQFEDKQADFMNPNMMTDMLTRNISNAIYYISLFVVGGFFFSGYILLKLPFGLTRTFKSMMQQGLSLPDFDPSYVSAISWCLILVFGINPILQFFDGGEDFSMFTQQKQMMTQPLNLMGNPMAGKNYEKILKPEKESINIVSNFSLLDDAVDTLIDRYKL